MLLPKDGYCFEFSGSNALYTGVALISDFAYLLDLIRGRQTADMLSAVIIDITTSVAFIEIIVPSIALRRLGQAAE